MSNDTVDTVNAVFRCESYRLFLLALPVDGVFQKEPRSARIHCILVALIIQKFVRPGPVEPSLYYASWSDGIKKNQDGGVPGDTK